MYSFAARFVIRHRLLAQRPVNQLISFLVILIPLFPPLGKGELTEDLRKGELMNELEKGKLKNELEKGELKDKLEKES